MSERKIRVGVVGAGSFAAQCHIPGIQRHSEGEVVALCARNRERAAAMARRFGIPAIFTDYHELIARPDIDAVTVATPDALHYPVAAAALRAGKHVFCEKPLTQTGAEARALTELADGSGRIAMVAFTYRYTRALAALRRLVRDGTIGRPLYVSAEVHWGGIGYPGERLTWREQSLSAAGVWGDGGPHLFDALAFALAPVGEVCAQMMIAPRPPGLPQPESIDLATCLARLRMPGATTTGGTAPAGSVHVTLLTSKVDRPRLGGDSMTVVGAAGAIDIALTRGQQERAGLLRRGEAAWADIPLGEDAGGDEPLALSRMMGAFVDAILRGRLDPDDPSFHDGLHAQEAIEAALRSAESGCWERVAGG